MTKDAETAYRFLTEKPAQYGQMLGYPDLRDDLHGQWIRDMVLGHEDMTLQAHRGSYKTTCACIGLSINILLRGDLNSIFLRKTDNDIQEVINNVNRIILHPVTQELYRAITGRNLAILKATSSEITTSSYTAPKGAVQLLGIGIGGSLTGKHADRVWTDDIVNLKDRKSRAEREQTKAIYQELQNVVNRGGRIINTGTPWHKEDAFTLMPPPERFDCYQTNLMTREKIEELRRRMSPSLFAANYELRHIAAENALFETAPKFTDEADLLRDGMAHIDAAYGGEDYTAFTCGKRRGDTLYMYGRMWQRHIDTVLDVCIAEAQRLQCGPVLCEDNGDKGFLAKEIKRRGHSARPYHEGENKYIKISTYLRKWWPNIVWLEGTDREYINQIMDYTEDAEHDDACLAGDTMIATLTGNKAIKDIKACEYVLTPAGVRKVTFAGITGYKEVNEYAGIMATHDHKIFDSASGEFVKAENLNEQSEQDRLSLKGLIAWKKKLLSSTGKPMSEIQRADITSSMQQEIVTAETRNNYTGQYGSSITGKSRRGITSIILMGMSIITTLATWNVYQLSNIFRNMAGKILKALNTGKRDCKNLQRPKKKRNNGIARMKGKDGIASTPQNPSLKRTPIQLKNAVSIAGKQCLQPCSKDSVPIVANQNPGVEKLAASNSFRTRENVLPAGSGLSRITSHINIATPIVNKDTIIPVYNLTVEKAGCYYANGILVSNCDSAACICRIFDRKSGTEYKSPFGG